jgi:hypothetical protein
VPTFPSLPTLKIKAFARGTASTGTAGFGFVSCNPATSPANDAFTVGYTLPSFSGTAITPGVVGTGNASSNAPYASTDFSNDATGVASRVVACGLRVRYGGTELARGGFKIGLVDPTHSTVYNRDLASMNSELQTVRLPVSRQWSALLYRAVRSNETEFATSINPTDVLHYMAFMLIAPDATSPTLFEWEFFTIVEYQGAPVRGQSHTDSDPNGYAAVTNVANRMNGVVAVHSSSIANEMLNAVGAHLKNSISGATHDIVSNAAKQIAGSSSSSFLSNAFSAVMSSIPIFL